MLPYNCKVKPKRNRIHVPRTTLHVYSGSLAQIEDLGGRTHKVIVVPPVLPPVSPSRSIYRRDIARADAHRRVSKSPCTTRTRDSVTYARGVGVEKYLTNTTSHSGVRLD